MKNINLRNLIFHLMILVLAVLKSVRRKNTCRIIFTHLNINSLRNKFDALVDQIKGNVDILVISDTSHYLFDGIEMNLGLELWFL